MESEEHKSLQMEERERVLVVHRSPNSVKNGVTSSEVKESSKVASKGGNTFPQRYLHKNCEGKP